MRRTVLAMVARKLASGLVIVATASLLVAIVVFVVRATRDRAIATPSVPQSDAVPATSTPIRRPPAELHRVASPLRALDDPKRAGEWMAGNHEPSQSFRDYLESRPNRRTQKRTRLYILPLGDWCRLPGDASSKAPVCEDAGQLAEARLLAVASEFLEVFYGVEVAALPPIGLDVVAPAARRRNPFTRELQLSTPFILDRVLVQKRPPDAIGLIAFTTVDLWPGNDWNFVFGQADLERRVGVWSFARFGDPETEWSVALRRTIALAAHETGHMMGIHHCVERECGMNGTNSLDETDRNRAAFCSEDELKVWWALGIASPEERYAQLVAFARKHGLERDAADWERSLEAIRSKERPQPF